MASTKRLARSFFRLLLPTLVLIVLAVMAASLWLVHISSEVPKVSYLVTPEKYGLLSTRGAKITEETWFNKDSTSARGWLLRGSEGAPAIVLLHRYGADRSWMLNLGVKLNEATDFTILMPDLRGHGENPLIRASSFGGAETEDALAAIQFLKGLKSEKGTALVGKDLGIYGVELGSLVGLSAAAQANEAKVLVLDSMPESSDEIVESAVAKRYPFVSSLTSKIAQGGTYLYYIGGNYARQSACETAKNTPNRKVLLIAGNDTPDLQTSTAATAGCFPSQTTVEKKLDLMPAGYNMVNASLEQSEAYDQRVIEFFKRNLTFSAAE